MHMYSGFSPEMFNVAAHRQSEGHDRRRFVGRQLHERQPRQPTNTRYKAANIEN